MAKSKLPLFDDIEAIYNDDDRAVETSGDDAARKDRVYDVDEILAERHYPRTGETKYLVKWLGYRLHRATWEPSHHFMHESLVTEWEERKQLAQRDGTLVFDPRKFEAALLARKRQKQRMAKRRRISTISWRRSAASAANGLIRQDASSSESSGDRRVASKLEGQSRTERRQTAALPSTDVPSSSEEGEIKTEQSPSPTEPAASPSEGWPRRQISNGTQSASLETAKTLGGEGTTAHTALQSGHELYSSTSSEDEASEQDLLRAWKRPAAITTARSSGEEEEDQDIAGHDSSSVAYASSLFGEGLQQGSQDEPRSLRAEPEGQNSSEESAPGPRSLVEEPLLPTAASGANPPPASVTKPQKKPMSKVASVFLPIDPSLRKPRPLRLANRLPQQADRYPDPSDAIQLPQFTRLQWRNNFQKFGRNEPTPMPDAISPVDPKTGRVEPSVGSAKQLATAALSALAREPDQPVTPSSATAQTPVQSIETSHLLSKPAAHARSVQASATEPVKSLNKLPNRSLPGPISNARPQSPRSAEQRSGGITTASANTSTSTRLKERVISSDSANPIVTTGKTQRGVCRFWLDGHCNRPEQQCLFAHYHVGHPPPLAAPSGPRAFTTNVPRGPHPPPKKSMTCYYWRERGACRFSEEHCEFAHHDTGVHATPPGKSVSNVSPTAHMASARTANDSQARQTVQSNVATASNVRATEAHQGITRAVPKPRTASAAAVESVACNLTNTMAPAQHAKDRPLNEASDSRNAAVQFSNADESTLGRAMNTASRDSTGSSALAARPPATSALHHKPPPEHAAQSQLRHDTSRRGTGGGVLHIQPEGLPEALEIKVNFTASDVAALLQLAQPSLLFDIQQSILVGDAQTILKYDPAALNANHICGSIEGVDEFAVQLASVIELCKLNDCGLIATTVKSGAKMLIFPGDSEAWRFLESAELHSQARMPLHFVMPIDFPGLPAHSSHTSGVPAERLGRNRAVTALSQQLGAFDEERFFPDSKTIDRAVFLMIPPRYSDEVDICKAFFAALGCKVYSSEVSGAWAYVRKNHPACLLIVHPDVPLWKVPGLHNFLQSGKVRVFSIGAGRDGQQESCAPLQCQRLFPHGAVYFVTDEVFMHYPEQATKIITRYLQRLATKPPGANNHRIATRPGIKPWLRKLMIDNTIERGRRKDRRWVELYNAICQLCPPDDEDAFGPLEDEDALDDYSTGESSNLISVAPSTMPTFQHIVDNKTRDPYAPTEWMVEWFAGWSLGHVGDFRMFFVCHAAEPTQAAESTVMDERNRIVEVREPVAKDPWGWAAKYRHLGVLTPSDCCEHIGNPNRARRSAR